MSYLEGIKEIEPCIWEIPKKGDMRVPVRIIATKKILSAVESDESVIQLQNVAHLPGIIKWSLAMPDIHWGYGFPIGGVAAMDLKEGVISPGGVGYDINCGVRLTVTNLHKDEIKKKVVQLAETLFNHIPCGVGRHGNIKLSPQEEKGVMIKGARWAAEHNYGEENDLPFIEENGCMDGADPSAISQRARDRGRKQLGTLGAGNHFVEVGYVDEIYDSKIAEAFGLSKNQVTVIIHSGSRGFGHQTCTDQIKKMMAAMNKYDIHVPDRQLCCAPIQSPEGQEYIAALNCSINYGFANRQIISHLVRRAFQESLQASPKSIGLHTVYEIAHNIAKIEEFEIDGKRRKVCVHRKGATRAFPAGHPLTPEAYRQVGQPVLIPGDMGRYSFVLVGLPKAMEYTFGSTCHGAGREMSRKKALKATKGRAIHRELEDRGIYVRSASVKTLREEASEAYKDVSNVVDAVHQAGISAKVARLRPMAVVKG